MKLIHCNDANCSGGDDSITVPDAVGAFAPSLELDTAGNPVVSYAAAGQLRVLHCNDPDCSGGDESITAPDSGSILDLSLALDGSGNPVVAYYDYGNKDLKVLRCNDANCSGGDESVTIPDAIGDVGALPSLALDAGGNPVISYADMSGLFLKVLHCNDVNCAGGDESITSQSPLLTGLSSAMVLDSMDHPVIAGPGSTGRLMLLHCNDADCSGANESGSLPALFVGKWDISLVLDSAGSPVVSYQAYPGQTQFLRVLHCNDANCVGGDETNAAPDPVTGGSYSSVALDGAGNPVVAYFVFGSYDLKLLHCVDANCQADTDGDGCPDGLEQQTAVGSETSGGIRNSKDAYDYSDPTHDGLNRINDVLYVVNQYFTDDNDGNPGLPPYAPGYNPDTDRTLLGPNAWNLGPPNGLQRVDDILNQVHHYLHDCS